MPAVNCKQLICAAEHRRLTTHYGAQVRLWNEEIRHPIMTSKYFKNYVLDATWSPTRPGVFLTTKMDGTLDVWDYYYKQNDPTLSLQVDDDGLFTVKMQEQGNLLATGSVDGSVYMLELCEGLAAMQSNEKQSVMQASMGGLAWPVPSACFCAAHVVGLCWARALSARLPTLAYNHRCIHVHLLLSPRLPTNSVAYVFRLCWAYVRSI